MLLWPGTWSMHKDLLHMRPYIVVADEGISINAGILTAASTKMPILLGIANEAEYELALTCYPICFSALITLIAKRMVMQIATIWLITLYDRTSEIALDSKETVNWVQELQAIVSRAALQSPESAQQLPEEVFWFATQPKDRLKWNLLSPGAFPWLKPFLRRFCSISSDTTIPFWAKHISTRSRLLATVFELQTSVITPNSLGFLFFLFFSSYNQAALPTPQLQTWAKMTLIVELQRRPCA